MTAIFIINIVSDRIKTVEGVALGNFQPYVFNANKNKLPHFFFNLADLQKN